MEIGSDSEDSFSKPTERKGKDNSTTLELLPPKSREVYENTYKRFMKWREDKKISSFSETVIIDYLADLSTTIKPTTLWGHYSMLKSTLNMKHGVNIKYYSNVIPYLKNKANGFLPTKSKTFTEDEINRFLTNAPDNKYLLTKVVLVFGVAGALRRDDLAEIRLEDIYDLGSVLVVKITKTKKPKTFTVTGDRNLTYYRKYIALRPVDMTETRLFIRYQNGMCLRQVVGVHKLTCTAQIVAAYLKLPDVKSYTGHCLRRTSAALLASEGADLKALRRQRSSESSTVTQSFKEESVTNKLEILENNLPPPKENIVISNEYTTISNVTNKIIKRNQPAGVPVLFSNCQNCTITLNVHHSKKNDTDNESKPSRKRKQDLASEEIEQLEQIRVKNTRLIYPKTAPIEEVMIKEEPSDEPVEEVFFQQQHINEPVEIYIKEERIEEPTEEMIVKEERLEDYPAHSKAYDFLQLQMKTEEEDAEKCQTPDQSSSGTFLKRKKCIN